MHKNPQASSRAREGQMKLIALLMYVAEQKRKSQHTMERLFNRLMLRGKG